MIIITQNTSFFGDSEKCISDPRGSRDPQIKSSSGSEEWGDGWIAPLNIFVLLILYYIK